LTFRLLATFCPQLQPEVGPAIAGKPAAVPGVSHAGVQRCLGFKNPDKKRSAKSWLISQPTPRATLAARHNVTAWCQDCGYVSELDLTGLIAAGHAIRPCSSCRCAVRGAARGGFSSRSPGG
jgi:hypothetical protein